MIKSVFKKVIFNNTVLQVLNRINPRNHFIIKKNHFYISNGSIIDRTSVKLLGHNNELILGQNCRLDKCLFIMYGSKCKISIGNNCQLNSCIFWMEDTGGSIVIGDNTTVNGKTEFDSIEGKTITVGSDCMFSSNIMIRTGDSHSIINNNGCRINPSKSITVGNHVWIGEGCTCLKGVNIPDNTIVGAKTILTHSITEHNTIIAGVPAKVVKHNVNWLRERI